MTLAVQLIPFIYGGLYAVSVVVYFLGPDSLSQVMDSLLYVSPLTIVCFLALSRMLRLCKWHKTACCVPLVPNAVSLVDYYVIELSEVTLAVEFLIVGSMIVLLLISAYKVFLC